MINPAVVQGKQQSGERALTIDDCSPKAPYSMAILCDYLIDGVAMQFQ